MWNDHRKYIFESFSFQDLVNKLTKSNSTVGEALAMYVTIEMLYMIEYLHKCQIIHGDVKPDNFLLIDM